MSSSHEAGGRCPRWVAGGRNAGCIRRMLATGNDGAGSALSSSRTCAIQPRSGGRIVRPSSGKTSDANCAAEAATTFSSNEHRRDQSFSNAARSRNDRRSASKRRKHNDGRDLSTVICTGSSQPAKSVTVAWPPESVVVLQCPTGNDRRRHIVDGGREVVMKIGSRWLNAADVLVVFVILAGPELLPRNILVEQMPGPS
jgi:hypothetical protein